MGFFKRIFGGNSSNLSNIIEETKAFIDPQITALSNEGIKLIISVKSVIYIYCVATEIAGRTLSDQEIESVLMSISDNDQLHSALKVAPKQLLYVIPTMASGKWSSVSSEMQGQARNDLAIGCNHFLIDHTKSVRKKIDAMFIKRTVELVEAPSSDTDCVDIGLGFY